MQTIDFLNLLARHPDKLLRFRDHRNALVHPSYHVSEVKVATYETVDCGGMAHRWQETILQLWLSDDPDAERAMSTGKAVGILGKVSRQIAIDSDTELRIEYGSEAFPPVVFHVGEIEEEAEAVVISLRPPTLQCKLEERGGSCARPQPALAEEEAEGDSSSCPGTGCC